jgi:lactam utilization protein B
MHSIELRDVGESIGAHPGYPDLLGGSRRNLNFSLAATRACLICQRDVACGQIGGKGSGSAICL